MAEACGNRTHLARVRRHAGFEDQEGHQAQSASKIARECKTPRRRVRCSAAEVSKRYSIVLPMSSLFRWWFSPRIRRHAGERVSKIRTLPNPLSRQTAIPLRTAGRTSITAAHALHRWGFLRSFHPSQCSESSFETYWPAASEAWTRPFRMSRNESCCCTGPSFFRGERYAPESVAELLPGAVVDHAGGS